jgi:AcrR family transcriptional regulator
VAQPAARNARGLATARRIEEAAVRLATERGLDGLTVDDICADVGVSQRTFFHHFPTKEDALLGLDVPRISEQRAREYLTDPSVPVLAGALRLIDLPDAHQEHPALLRAQLRLLATSPALQARQGQRFAPLMAEMSELITLRLRAASRQEDEALVARRAAAITAVGAALMNHVAAGALAGTGGAPFDLEGTLELVRPVWGDLL